MKKQKQVFCQTYTKGNYYPPEKVIALLQQPTATAEVINVGAMDDDTEFTTVRIAGLKFDNSSKPQQ